MAGVAAHLNRAKVLGAPVVESSSARARRIQEMMNPTAKRRWDVLQWSRAVEQHAATHEEEFFKDEVRAAGSCCHCARKQFKGHTKVAGEPIDRRLHNHRIASSNSSSPSFVAALVSAGGGGELHASATRRRFSRCTRFRVELCFVGASRWRRRRHCVVQRRSSAKQPDACGGPWRSPALPSTAEASGYDPALCAGQHAHDDRVPRTCGIHRRCSRHGAATAAAAAAAGAR